MVMVHKLKELPVKLFIKPSPDNVDKICDRISGAIVDMSYNINDNVFMVCNVMISDNICYIVNKTNTKLNVVDVKKIVNRLYNKADNIIYNEYNNDNILNKDNIYYGMGVYKGMVINKVQNRLTDVAVNLYDKIKTDYVLMLCYSDIYIEINGKYNKKDINKVCPRIKRLNCISGVNVGCNNNKCFSDIGYNVFYGGINGKSINNVDVLCGVYAFIKAQKIKDSVNVYYDGVNNTIDGKDYNIVKDIVKQYIVDIGGFEKLAEWGLINGRIKKWNKYEC